MSLRELPWRGLRKCLKRWLGRVAARVALERPAGRFGRGSCRGERLLLECAGHGRFHTSGGGGIEGFEGFDAFEGKQTAGLNALKNRWLLLLEACGRV